MSYNKFHIRHIITQNFSIVIKSRKGKSRIISVPAKSGIFIMFFRQIFPESLIFRSLISYQNLVYSHVRTGKSLKGLFIANCEHYPHSMSDMELQSFLHFLAEYCASVHILPHLQQYFVRMSLLL